MKYRVQKRIINNYYVEVDANSPEEAIAKAADNDHGPGEPTSDDEDGDTFYPSEWRVYEKFHSPKWEELNFGVDRSALEYLD